MGFVIECHIFHHQNYLNLIYNQVMKRHLSHHSVFKIDFIFLKIKYLVENQTDCFNLYLKPDHLGLLHS